MSKSSKRSYSFNSGSPEMNFGLMSSFSAISSMSSEAADSSAPVHRLVTALSISAYTLDMGSKLRLDLYF